MKKLSFISLCLVMMVSLITGCGSSQQTSQPAAKDAGSSATPEKKEPAENKTSESKAGDITLGAVFPLTGTGATYGGIFKQGVELAIEDINKAGGIKGKKLAIDYQDGRGEPKASVLAAQNLAAKGYPAILSSYTGATLAILPIAERQKVAVFNGGGQGDVLAGASPFLFNTIPLLGLEVDVLARYLGEEKKFKTAYIIHVDDDSGRSGLEKFTDEFSEYGGKVVGSSSHKLGETNFRSLLIKAKSTNPDILYIASHGQDAKQTIDQARELGLKSTIVNTSWTIIPEIVSDPHAQGIIHTSLAFNPDKEWINRFKEKYGTDQVSSYIVNYYDAIMIFAKAYEHAVNKGYGTDGDAIRKAVSELKNFESVNGKISFNDDGTSVRAVNISVIEGNKSNVVKSY